MDVVFRFLFIIFHWIGHLYENFDSDLMLKKSV